MAFREETGWLIEFSQRVSVQPCWYGKTDDGLGQTTDAGKALRFARKEDAEMVIEDIGWTEARATDHMWCDYSHDWHERFNLTCCRDCGIVKRDDDQNGPCKGPMKLRPLEAPFTKPDDGWRGVKPKTDAWMIVYEDADRAPLTFTGEGAEEAAHKTFAHALTNWNCHLFQTIGLNPAPPHTKEGE